MPTSERSNVTPRSAARVRILAPDLARGLTLVGIAMANVTTAWLAAPADWPAAFLGGIVHNSTWDKIAVVFGAVFVHVRGLPMFATMLGYGIGMLALSLRDRQYPPRAARNVLLRRYGFLALFGLVHMTLLFYGDIMFFYGVAGMLLALMITWRSKTLLVIAGVAQGVLILPMAASSLVLLFIDVPLPAPSEGGPGSRIATTWTEYFYGGLYAAARQVGMLIMEIPMMMPLMLLGFVAARHRVLEHPERHKKLLVIAVAVSVSVMVLIGLPWGLAEIGVLPHWISNALLATNQALGLLTGPGIVAMIALAAIPFQRRFAEAHEQGAEYRLPLLLHMLVALGKRSMTGYVLQSVILLPLCAPFLLGVLRPEGAALTTLIGVALWLVTLLIAFALEKAGKPGPFEAAHRRLSYGKQGLHRQYPTTTPIDAPTAPPALPADGVGGAASIRE